MEWHCTNKPLQEWAWLRAQLSPACWILCSAWTRPGPERLAGVRPLYLKAHEGAYSYGEYMARAPLPVQASSAHWLAHPAFVMRDAQCALRAVEDFYGAKVPVSRGLKTPLIGY
jgi:predicted N-acyltransferase